MVMENNFGAYTKKTVSLQSVVEESGYFIDIFLRLGEVRPDVISAGYGPELVFGVLRGFVEAVGVLKRDNLVQFAVDE